MTFKGSPELEDGLKKRTEIEVVVSDVHSTLTMFGAMGYREILKYTKKREPWRLADTQILLDTLPAGLFCEIEGPEESVREMASHLKLKMDASETRDYRMIVKQYLDKTT